MPDAPDHFTYSDGVDIDFVHLPDENYPFIPDSTAIFEQYITNQWIHAELNLPQGELRRKVKVFSRYKDANGEMKGSCDHNAFLYSLAYDVEFPDGDVKEHSDNSIAETCMLKLTMRSIPLKSLM